MEYQNITSTTTIPTLQWFEYVCELLSKNPNEATKLLLSFRNSTHAIMAREFLINTNIPIVKQY